MAKADSDSEVLVSSSWARTYRPRKYRDLVGQDSSVAVLRGLMKQNKVPGFMLVVGPSGCGKTTIARLFNRYINCDKGTACGLCASCLHDPDNHPDVNELNAANERGIDEMRRLVQNSRFKPRYRIRMVILDEAHQLTPQAQQAFLKPLEDTPKSTMYVICTTDPEKLPPAMLTRPNVTLQVRMPTAEQMLPRLQAILDAEKQKMSKDLLQGIIEASGGSMRGAINQMETASAIMASDPKADAKTVLIALGAAASAEATFVGMKLTIAMHMESPKNVVKAVYDVEDPVPTVNMALRFNEYLMGVLSIKGQHPRLWHTNDCRDFMEALKDKVEKPSLAHAAAVQAKLTEVRNLLVSVSTNSRSILLGKLL